MRLDMVRVSEHRTVFGDPVELQLGLAVTVLVGPNLAGKSNLARALACALDARVPFDLDRERPTTRPGVVPTVELFHRDRTHGRPDAVTVTVSWPEGHRVVDVRPAQGAGRVTAPELEGRPVLAWASDRPADVLARLADELAGTDPVALAGDLLPTVQRILPEAASIDLPDGVGGAVVVRDTTGFPIADHAVRATFAAALAAHLVRQGVELTGVIVEEPEVFLHPAAQELLRDEFLEVGVAAEAPVLFTTESPFMIPRDPDVRVIAIARDPVGRTRVVGTAAGDEPQASLLGGLFRDGGFAAVLDRTSRIPPQARGVVVVEGGTDEAYLRLAGALLDRADLLGRLAIHPAGGALPAAMHALILRAETDLPVLVVLDNDPEGRRARDTLVSRFGFTNRTEVTTYAEVVPDHPLGTEAEDLFDWRLVARFVDELGDASIRGKRILRADEWHHDLTLAAKSAFVAWVEEHARASDCTRWAAILDVLDERLLGAASADEPQG